MDESEDPKLLLSHFQHAKLMIFQIYNRIIVCIIENDAILNNFFKIGELYNFRDLKFEISATLDLKFLQIFTYFSSHKKKRKRYFRCLG